MELMEIKVDVFKDTKTEQKNDFWTEFAQGYLEIERMENVERVKEYSKAYSQIKDKDSFNAQYLKTLIGVLEDEI